MTAFYTDAEAFESDLLEALRAPDPIDELDLLASDPHDLLGDGEGCVCGVTGYGLANRRLALVLRLPRLAVDFTLPMPSLLADEADREDAAQEIRLMLKLVAVMLVRHGTALAEGERFEASVSPDEPLLWRVWDAAGEVAHACDDWGKLADLFGEDASGENASFVIYP